MRLIARCVVEVTTIREQEHHVFVLGNALTTVYITRHFVFVKCASKIPKHCCVAVFLFLLLSFLFFYFLPPFIFHLLSLLLTFSTIPEDMRNEKDSTVKDWKGRLQMLLARRYRGVFFKICYDAPKSVVSWTLWCILVPPLPRMCDCCYNTEAQ